MTRVLRAVLRWITHDPKSALDALRPHLPEPTPRGRPKTQETNEPEQ